MERLAIIHVSSLPPRRCGVAEYTRALSKHLHEANRNLDVKYVRLVGSVPDGTDCSGEIICDPTDQADLAKVGQIVSAMERKVVFLQHEFKLYGGSDGENVLRLLDQIDAPIVTTLHTVWPSFPPIRDRIFRELSEKSTILIVFSPSAAQILIENYGTPPAKVRTVPHGIPSVAFRPAGATTWPGLSATSVKFLTLGLIRPSKGIETALLALAQAKAEFRDFQYVLCGMPHPKNSVAVDYYSDIRTKIESLNLRENVLLIDRYVENSELIDLVQACDVGVLPYSVEGQSSSGVLALILGCGRPAIATAFQYATAVVQPDMGVIVPIGSVEELVRALVAVGKDRERREQMMQASYQATRGWCWNAVAQRYLEAGMEALAKSRCGVMMDRSSGDIADRTG